MIACGVLAHDVRALVGAHGWPVDVVALPPLLHNRPDRIAGAVRTAVGELAGRYARVVVGYADCGTYGALDQVCRELGVTRLPGLHCYDVLAGPSRVAALLAEEPGSYLLTDFLVRGFDRLVVRELGLDRHPELRADYFAHYRRVVWLRQDPALRPAAEAAADRLGLPLVEEVTGSAGLDAALAALLA